MTDEAFQEYLNQLQKVGSEEISIVLYGSNADVEVGKKRIHQLKEKAFHFGMSGQDFDNLYQTELDKTVAAQIKKSENSGFTPFRPFEKSEFEKLPVFPVEQLPDVLQNMAGAISESLQVSIDMPAAGILAVLAACLQGKFSVNVKPDWFEQLSLYVLIVARPSERKSPCLSRIKEPVTEYEREENALRAPAIEEYEMHRDILQKQIVGLKESAAKPSKKSEGSFDPLQSIISKKRELDELEPVKRLRLLADDVTPEKFTSLMAENDGKMAIISAEGGIFNILSGLYSQKVNIDPFLKAYSGDYIQIDRQGRPSETIAHPALTMLLMIQPSVLEEVMHNSEFAGRGLTARFMYCLPPSRVGEGRKYNTAPIPKAVSDSYSSLIYSLLDLPDGNNILRMSPEADAVNQAFFNWLEPRFDDDLECVEAWAGKLHGNIARIAGLIHCCINLSHSAEVPISGQTMANAVKIGQYFIAHSKAAFEMMGQTETKAEKDAKYIVKRLISSGESCFCKRDVLRLCRKFKKSDEMEPSLTLLIDRGYIKIEKQDSVTRDFKDFKDFNDSKPSKGRPPEKIYLNPAVHSAMGGN